MRPARILLAAAPILLTILTAMPAEAQLRVGGGYSVGRARGNLYAAQWHSHSTLATVDTLRLRYLLLNGGDGPVTVHIRPCGIRVEAEVQLDAAPPPHCELEPRTLQPGDSVRADWSGRLIAEPGRHTLTVHYIGAPDESGALVTGQPVGVTVVPLEPGGRTAVRPPATVGLEPYLLRLGGIVDNPAARADFENVFQHGAPADRHLVAFDAAAAAARARTRPILVVDLRIDEHVRRRRSDWGIRIGRYTTTIGWLSIAADGTEAITCNHGGSAMDGGLPAFGAMLARDIRAVLEGGDRCGR